MADQRVVHWQRTRSLMIVNMIVWFIFSFGIHWFAPQLNKISFIGFPLGFYMAAQGSLIVFVVQLFLFAKMQNAIDVDCGMAEDK